MDPLTGIYTAVTRQSLDGHLEGGWQAQERLDLHSSIHGYTLGGAISNGIADQRGSLAVGKYADLVIMSDNLFTIEPSAIRDVRVVTTYFEGQLIYQSQ
jgi:predicted amidohydrolase YtcJ